MAEKRRGVSEGVLMDAARAVAATTEAIRYEAGADGQQRVAAWLVAPEHMDALRGWMRQQDAEEEGIRLIADERRRQVGVEGWTPEHDDGHGGGELALAAAWYALPAPERERRAPTQAAMLWELLWPWSLPDWKPAPGDRVRELTRAGALIAAEIDRLRRLAAETT